VRWAPCGDGRGRLHGLQHDACAAKPLPQLESNVRCVRGDARRDAAARGSSTCRHRVPGALLPSPSGIKTNAPLCLFSHFPPLIIIGMKISTAHRSARDRVAVTYGCKRGARERRARRDVMRGSAPARKKARLQIGSRAVSSASFFAE